MLSTVQLLFVNIMFITPSEPLPMPRLGIYLSQLQCFQPCLQPSCQWHEPTALQKGIAPSLHNQKTWVTHTKIAMGMGWVMVHNFPPTKLVARSGYELKGVMGCQEYGIRGVLLYTNPRSDGGSLLPHCQVLRQRARPGVAFSGLIWIPDL